MKEVEQYEKLFNLTHADTHFEKARVSKEVKLKSELNSIDHSWMCKNETTRYNFKAVFENLNNVKEYIADEIQDLKHLKAFIEEVKKRDIKETSVKKSISYDTTSVAPSLVEIQKQNKLNKYKNQ